MIYFDNAATSRPFQEVVEEYSRLVVSNFGNPNSPHHLGMESSRLLEKSREEILKLLHLEKSHKLIFTSGATEGNNLAIKGASFFYQNRGKRIITDAGEHASVLEAFKELKENFGFDVIILPLLSNGQVDLKALKEAMNKDTILVSILATNNETGARNSLKEISSIVREYPKCFYHVDATQAMGKENLDYSLADFISFSAHKFGGLKYQGGLLLKKSIKLLPLSSGGEQEDGYRSGTCDPAMAKAVELALKHSYSTIKEEYEKIDTISNFLKLELTKMNEIQLNSDSNCSPYILSFSFKYHKASVIVEALSNQGIYLSSHAACSNRLSSFSPVLLAMGIDKDFAGNAARLSLGRENNIEEAKTFLNALKTILKETHTR